MLWFIIAFIAAIVYAVWYYMGPADQESIWAFLIPLAAALVGGTLAAGFLCFMGDFFFEDGVDYKEEHALIAISDGSHTAGRFFLGSGTVGAEERFTYYKAKGGTTLDGKGIYTLESQPAKLSTVQFTDGRPKVVTKHMNGGNFWLAPWPNYSETYEFHVPEGSIVQNYQLDAQ